MTRRVVLALNTWPITFRGMLFYHQPTISRVWQGIVDAKRLVLGKIRLRSLVYHVIDLSSTLQMTHKIIFVMLF
jgi:hypothetical protein